MFMGSITRIHNVCLDVSCEVMRGTGACVSHHHHIHFHCENIVDGIQQGFTFFYGAGGG